MAWQRYFDDASERKKTSTIAVRKLNVGAAKNMCAKLERVLGTRE